MMKKMYEDGDDEMKRTIAKAWTEGQDKKTQDGFWEESSNFTAGTSLAEIKGFNLKIWG